MKRVLLLIFILIVLLAGCASSLIVEPSPQAGSAATGFNTPIATIRRPTVTARVTEGGGIESTAANECQSSIEHPILCIFYQRWLLNPADARVYGTQTGLILSECCVMVMLTLTDNAVADGFMAFCIYGRGGCDGHFAFLHSRYEWWLDVWVWPGSLEYWQQFPGVEFMEPSQYVQ